MVCMKCGRELPEDAVFCDQCGEKITLPIVDIPVEHEDFSWAIESDEDYQKALKEKAEVDEYSDTVYSDSEMLSENSNAPKTRNMSVIGLIGGLLIIIGEFMPFTSYGLMSFTFFDTLIVAFGAFAGVISVGIPALIIFFYAIKKDQYGVLLSVISFLVYIFMILMGDGKGISAFLEDFLRYLKTLSIGFYMIPAGFVIAIFAPKMHKTD